MLDPFFFATNIYTEHGFMHVHKYIALATTHQLTYGQLQLKKTLSTVMSKYSRKREWKFWQFIFSRHKTLQFVFKVPFK